jgi:hypothetical protein
LSHQLVALERTSDASLTLTFAVAGGTLKVQCDCAILALPFSALRHVDYQQAGFDPLKQIAIEEPGYGTISKLFLQFDRPYWYEHGPWPHPDNGFVITDLDMQTLWDTSPGQTGSSGLLVDYMSGHRGAACAPPTAYSTTADSPSLQQYAQNCLQQLESVFPGISAHYTGKAALSYPTLFFWAVTPVGVWDSIPTSMATRACARDPFTSRANIARSRSRVLWKGQPERARVPLGRLCRMWREGDIERAAHMIDRPPEPLQRAMRTLPLSRHFFNREGEKHGEVKASFIWRSELAEEPFYGSSHTSSLETSSCVPPYALGKK